MPNKTEQENAFIQHEEDDMAEQLKAQCYLNGRESEPKKSAHLIHKLALLYRKTSPNKLNLIRSAVLLNAAIVREPDNVTKVQGDLQGLCKHILEVSKARNQKADLIETALTIKQEITKMRIDTQQHLNNIPEISSTEDNKQLLEDNKIRFVVEIQNQITLKYIAIMKSIAEYCIDVMGTPPCTYTLAGLGSLSRKEITPYSDFESVVLLEEGVQRRDDYDGILDYFRWWAVFFQIVLVNLQETIIRFAAIRSLNDPTGPHGDWFYDSVTTCGICPDGFAPHACKNPLGRSEVTANKHWTTELIKPVSEMAKYLHQHEDVKNGYYLADILTKTCFVAGDSGVYDLFLNHVAGVLKNQNENKEITKEFARQNEKNIVIFDTLNNIQNFFDAQVFDIKRVIYRTATMFISALGRHHNIEELSCFDIIGKLAARDLITREYEHKLKYAVAVACEIRLKVYLNKGGQDDFVEVEKGSGQLHTELIELVGKQVVVDYFEIVYTLHKHFTIGMAFNEKIDFGTTYSIRPAIRHYMQLYDENIEIMEKEAEKLSTSDRQDWVSKWSHLQCLKWIGLSLFKQKKFDSALAHYSRLKIMYESSSYSNVLDVDNIADCFYHIGMCYFNQQKYEEAQENFQKQLDLYRKEAAEDDYESNEEKAICMKNIGVCMMELGKNEDALSNFQTALDIRKTLPKDAKTNQYMADCHFYVGDCLKKLEKYRDALHQFEKALELRRLYSREEAADELVADCLYMVGWCLYKLNRPKEAMVQLSLELSIRRQKALDPSIDEDTADCLCVMGLCLMELKDIETALTHLEESRVIRKQISVDEHTDQWVANCEYNIALCMLELNKREEACRNFEVALQIRNHEYESHDKKIIECIEGIEKCRNQTITDGDELTQTQRNV